MRSCSVRVKKLVKVGMPEEGGVQLDIFLKGEILSWMLLCKKYCVSMRFLKLFQDLFVSCLKVFVGVGTKDKPLVRTDNSSSVNMWSERLCIMFLLYWEVYALMELAVNLRNEDLHWFSGKRTFDGGVYMRFNRGLGSRIISSVFLWFSVSFWTTNVSSCLRSI